MRKEISDKFEFEPILNPKGKANKKETKSVIKALSTVPKTSPAYNYTQKMIKALKKEYEQQSERYYHTNKPIYED